jgi:hypothetical protein
VIYLAVLVLGQTLDFPTEFKGDPGQFITIKPTKTDGKMIQYYAIDPGLSVFPAALLVDPTATVVSAVQPGNYRLLAWTAVADKPSPASLIRVSIGKVNPPMPTPPIDSLQLDIQSIYAALNEPDKDETRRSMVQVYKTCSEKSKTATSVNDLFLRLQEQTKKLPQGKLLPIRQRISSEIEKIVGTDPDAQLTPQQQNALADLFHRTSVYLEGI